jgi:hypothetical protein
MSYEEDVASLHKWEKVRIALAIAATAVMVLVKAFDLHGLRWVESFVFLLASVAFVGEGRALARLGRSATLRYVAAGFLVLAAYLVSM